MANISLLICFIKILLRWTFQSDKDQLDNKCWKSIKWKKKIETIPETSTSDAATEESSELERSKDARILEQCKEIHLLTQKKVILSEG